MNPIVLYYQEFFWTFCADPCIYTGAEGGEIFVSSFDSRHQAGDQHQHLVITTDNTKRVDPDRFVILTLFKKQRRPPLLQIPPAAWQSRNIWKTFPELCQTDQ